MPTEKDRHRTEKRRQDAPDSGFALTANAEREPAGRWTRRLAALLGGQRRTRGQVDYVSFLTNDDLIIVGRFDVEDDAALEAFLVDEDGVVPIQVRCLSLARSGAHAADSRAEKLLTARMPPTHRKRQWLGQLILQVDGERFAVAPDELSARLTDIRALTRSSLSGLDRGVRQDVLEFFAATGTAERADADEVHLRNSLLSLREMLRERLPRAILAAEEPQCVFVETLAAVDERCFYVKGWMHDAQAWPVRLTAVSPEGARAELLGDVYFYPRPDVERFFGHPVGRGSGQRGFLGYFELRAPSRLADGWVVELENETGAEVEFAAPSVARDPMVARRTILETLPTEVLPDEDLMANHVFPAVSRLQERCTETAEVEAVLEYGNPVASPDVSIIVPLYGRIDFLEHQLAQFVNDREIFETDLIYVLDSPELAKDLKDYAAQLSPLYRVPFRVALLKRTVGFSGANNAAAALARGRLLVLLNSDVFPAEPGWIGRMARFYDATPQIGALGPKLLFEDGTLQHAGLYFALPGGGSSAGPLANAWENKHYFKGLRQSATTANIARPVPAVTAACLMIAKDLYASVGGLQGIYVQGDHEDSDLSLRLIEAGRENWYLPQAALYHLEAQSYPETWRLNTALYNRWLHTKLWGDRIQAVMASFEHLPGAPADSANGVGASAGVDLVSALAPRPPGGSSQRKVRP